jgi:hypothetical protein
MVTRARAVALAVALAACASVELEPPVLRARIGPAAERTIRRIVAMPATCGALSYEQVGEPEDRQWASRSECPAAALEAADMAIRSALELGGFHVIDAERVNAVTADRREVIRRSGDHEQREIEVIGARFEDATPFDQAAILEQLGAEGLVTTRIAIGASAAGLSQRRTLVVQVRLLATPDGALAWARRCDMEVAGLLASDDTAIERGARCAITGARAR